MKVRWQRVLVAVSLVAVMAACGGGSGDDDGSANASDASATTTANGGIGATTGGGDADVAIDRDATLRLGWTVPPGQLDPHIERHAGERAYMFPLYDRLFQIDDHQQIQPMVATASEFSADGLTLTLTIRDDIKFHDGTPLDADAVKMSLDRGRTLQDSAASRNLAVISSIDVTDPTTVVLHLSAPAADLLARLATVSGSILNPTFLATGGSLAEGDPNAGSGPYVVSEYLPNDRVVYTRVDQPYWDPTAANFETIELIGIPESQTRMAALRSGEIDAMLVKQDQYQEAQDLASSEDLQFQQYNAQLNYALLLRNTRSEFGNPLVREAMEYAIDENAISDQLLDGNCAATSQLWPEGHIGHDDDIDDAYPYDPDKAKQLLTQAGLPDGFSFDAVVLAGFSPQNEIAQVIQSELAEVGIQMSITPLSAAEATPQWRAGQWDAYVNFIAAETDPNVVMQTSFLAGENLAGPDAGLISDKVEEALDPSLSVDQRGAIYQDISTTISEQNWFVPICHQPTMFLFPKNILHLDTMSWAWAGIFDVRYLAQAAG